MVRKSMKRRITLTLDPDLLKKLQAQAEAERRSLSNLIELLLSRSIKTPKKERK